MINQSPKKGTIFFDYTKGQDSTYVQMIPTYQPTPQAEYKG